MDHPVFYNLRSFIIYISILIIISLINLLIMYFNFFPDLSFAIADSLVFNLNFGFWGLTLWFVVNYSNPEKTPLLSIIINHITSFLVFMAVWLSTSYLLVKAFFTNPDIIKFLEGSLPWEFLYGTFFYLILVLFYYLVVYYRNVNERKLQETRLQSTLRETELNMLKSQINPHFLFNSLNSISSLTITNPGKAQRMIIQLSDFLRYNVSSGNQIMIDLKDEIENIHRYLEIEKVRFGNKLKYVFDINRLCDEVKIPVMLLQPLYENAVKHGVYESSEPILIKTACSDQGNFVELIIRNNFEPGAKKRKGAGLGLKNIKDRLKLIYKKEDLLKTGKTKDTYKVSLIIPKQ